jgi:uncharacterized lipoprotein
VFIPASYAGIASLIQSSPFDSVLDWRTALDLVEFAGAQVTERDRERGVRRARNGGECGSSGRLA